MPQQYEFANILQSFMVKLLQIAHQNNYANSRGYLLFLVIIFVRQSLTFYLLSFFAR